MNEYLLQVPGVSCGHCVIAISSSVGQLPGVTGVDVDLTAKTVRVTGTAPYEAVCTAIDDAGYEVA